MKSRNGHAMADGGSATVVGEVVEWLMAPVLKTGEVKASVGSNPTLSVLSKSVPELGSQPKPLSLGSASRSPSSSMGTYAVGA